MRAVQIAATCVLGILTWWMMCSIVGCGGKGAPAPTAPATAPTTVANDYVSAYKRGGVPREESLRAVKSAPKEVIDALAKNGVADSVALALLQEADNPHAKEVFREMLTSDLPNTVADASEAFAVLSGKKVREKVDSHDQRLTKVESRVTSVANTADRAEIKANSAVKIARDAQTLAETAAKTANGANESLEATSKRLDAMGEKLATTKAELEAKLENESAVRNRWEKAKAKADAEAKKIRQAETNRVRVAVLRAVEDKAAEAAGVANSLRRDLREEISARSALAQKVSRMEERIAEQKRLVATAEAEAKASAESAKNAAREAKEASEKAGMIYVIPTYSYGYGYRCR